MTDRALATFERLFGPEFGHGKPFDGARMAAALAALGAPQERIAPVLHVAGTNGKGSTIAFMRAIAEAGGLRVHAFTKPHLFQLRERFTLAGAEADDETLSAAAARVAAADPQLSQFDAQVAAALLLFAETPADVVLLETGMGGRDDSTNVIARPTASILTPIGRDHQDVLGETLPAIAAHKAGILKHDVPAIVARQAPEATAVIEAHAAALGAPLHRQGVEWDAYASHGRLVVQTETRALDLPLPTLHGAHQRDNAGLACAALLTAGLVIAEDAFAAGVSAARWPARLQPLTRGRFSAPIRALGGEVWIDGGHNADAGIALSSAMQEMKAQRGGANIAIVGLRKRKNATLFIAAMARFADRIICVPLAEDYVSINLMAAIGAELGAKTDTAPSLTAAMQNAAQFPAPRVLICGSFLLAAEALAAEAG